jgi:broad specificity phosphatase PhoE
MIRVAVLLALAAAGTNAAAAEPTACVAASVHLARHAEKAAAIGGDADVVLSEAGRARAQALLAWFDGKPLDAIYTTDLRRTQQTALPLAAARRLELRVLAAHDDAGLLRRLRERHCGGHVLVIGHSNTVPAIAQALGAAPFTIGDGEFGVIYTLMPPSNELRRERFGGAD